MSGPIIRKYGFPNFDKIFGERPMQHGADEGAAAVEEAPQAAATVKKAAKPKPAKKAAKPKTEG